MRSRLRVDDELELGRLHDRQIRDLRTFHHTASINASLTERIVDVGSVTHQSARLDIVARRKAAALRDFTRPMSGNGLVGLCSGPAGVKDVDARDKRGHDENVST
jgi:hypothetical protein